MIKLNGNIRCPKCDRGSIQFLVRQHDSPKIQFSTTCSRCKIKVYFVLTISREEPSTAPAQQFIVDPKPCTNDDIKSPEKLDATQRPTVKSQDNVGENKPTKGEKTNVLPNPQSKLSKKEKDELEKLFDGLD